FNTFDGFLRSKPSADSVQNWIAEFPKDIPESEALLIKDAARLFNELHALPEPECDAVRKPVLSMSAGMKHFTGKKKERGELRVRNLGELNAYCFFVAGVVGEMLTRLVRARALDYRLTQSELSRLKIASGARFGLFLQKINILKDQTGDELSRRFFVHDRGEVLSSLKDDAEHAIAYLLSIPERMSSYRRFCAWALFLGLATVPLLKMPEAKAPRKLPRTEALLLAARLELEIKENAKLQRFYSELAKKAFSDVGASASSFAREQDGIYDLYQGELSEAEFQQLLT
ncbi:MAG TPA: squalene/phytoene synthase family protein, partial [Bdellovibrionales bacterium]|nr:squalene/phytoene synthase family protein [Bdellovibrionales bacterium]